MGTLEKDVIVNKEYKELQEIKKMNIYEKMSLITDEIGVVLKNLKVQVTKTNSYKAVSERDVLDKVKPVEKKYRVYSYPLDREIIENEILTKETDYGTSNQFFMRIQTIYRFVNIDNPQEYLDMKTYGDGIDSGDKAGGKAMTYADKYGLMKAYKISTGDDPDQDPSPENGYKKEQKPTNATPKKEITDDSLEITKQFQEALVLSGVDLDTILEHYKVAKVGDLSKEQKLQAIKKMRSNIQQQKSILEEASEQLKEEGLE